ncbi:hypothetical protein TEA_015347 [Camellia sinensis var. sinensis]|uniref:Uncharacterized protein n=1 Tax=Camellia sinensis var. sinensis TaxID=542762 RepID=A0A4S4F263_CAMSN|nr:hypothetical protein TEA_015347 [Camellia sinensis var. sinensis]
MHSSNNNEFKNLSLVDIRGCEIMESLHEGWFRFATSNLRLAYLRLQKARGPTIQPQFSSSAESMEIPYRNCLKLEFSDEPQALMYQLWTSYSNTLFLTRNLTDNRRILQEGVDFKQIDKEWEWDNFIILQALMGSMACYIFPALSNLPLWESRNFIAAMLLHIGVSESLYYWLRKSGSGTFLEHLILSGVIGIPVFGSCAIGYGSICMIYGYVLIFDFLRCLGHCNVEIVPYQLFDRLPFLKYLLYTPTVINGIIALASREKARVTLADIQYCYTMCGLKLEKGYIYYLKPRSTEYKLVADLPDSNKGLGDNYFIVSGNWEFAPDEDLHLYPFSRTIFIEALPQPPKDFRKSFFPSKDFKKLLDLPVQKQRAPLLLNYIPTYKFVLPDVLKKKSKSPPSATTLLATSSPRPDQASTSNLAERPSTSAPHLILPSQRKRRRQTTIAVEIGRKKVVIDDLLADSPDTVNAQPSPSQSKPKPKPKRLKKAQPKAMVTQIDTKDTLPISKLAESEKTFSTVEKRPTEAEPSQLTRSKRPRSEPTTTSRSLKSDAPWAPAITIEDKPVRAGDNADDIEVGVALFTALLLPKDLNRNVDMSKHKNFALMLQHSIQALIDRAEVAKKAQDEALVKADAAEAIAKVLETEKNEAQEKTAEAQAELQVALTTKDVEIKAADEKAYAEGAADVNEDYKKQVKQACNKGFTLGWMAALKKLAVPEDSPLKNAGDLILSFPFTPSQSEDEVESEEEDEAEKKEAAGAKSPTLNEQVPDLFQDEEDEVSKGASAEKTSFEASITEKSLDQILKEIDVELAAEKVARKSSQMSSEPQSQPANDVE